jgi:hypothetical protein
MYSLFVGTFSSQTFITCEHRGGISGTLFSAPIPIYMARLAVIDDQIKHGELHLLRTVPLTWLNSDKPTRFENIPTEFGPISLQLELQQGGKKLNVRFEPRFRHQPRLVVLYVPPLASLEQVVVNDRVLKAKAGEVLNVQ